jgi:hypothetical protein
VTGTWCGTANEIFATEGIVQWITLNCGCEETGKVAEAAICDVSVAAPGIVRPLKPQILLLQAMANKDC